MNTQVQQEIRDALKLNLNVDKIPNVVPVIEVNPKLVKNCNVKTNSSVTSGTVTMLTTPINQDIYITGCSLNFVKNVTCDIATGVISIICVLNGASTNIIALSVLTLTAERDSLSLTFPNAIKVDRNTNISLSGTFTAGALARCGSIHYIIDEQSLQ